MSDPATVLLVEDNADDVLLIQRAFRKANLPSVVQVVTHGEAAVDYLAGAGDYGDRLRYPLPVLVLLDLKLPRKSGLEVLTWRRQQAEVRRLPMVVLTSSREVSDLHAAYDLGANSYLVKPVGFDALLDMLKAVDHYWTALNERPLVEGR
jgi:CheY-like chemotaxis protein